MIRIILFTPDKMPQAAARLSKIAVEEGFFPLCCTQVMVSDGKGQTVPGGFLYTLAQQVVFDKEETEPDTKGNGHAKAETEDLGHGEVLTGTTSIT